MDDESAVAPPLGSGRGRFPKRVAAFVPDTLLEPYAEMAFNLSGKLAAEVLSGGQNIVQRGLASGTSTREIAAQLDAYFAQWYKPSDVPEDNVVPLRAGHRLENIARTEFGNAYNAGRNALMLDEDVSEENGGVLRGFVYDATLDSRTSDYCRAWHGKVFPNTPEGRALWQKHGPLAHYQCRAMGAPWTVFDGEIPASALDYPRGDDGGLLQPMVGFGGSLGFGG